ncbi:hypothetical protein [Halodesulfovibrio spirochaetisodalis]|uniref:hypothetical protein n=1 Tax=Halodesulfovibrio spirochaetisodalis TaxID=1560234 RepID=UPI0009EF455E|nr:hypothetical protein [Halodesulfovibrio spirochaetisodalis]
MAKRLILLVGCTIALAYLTGCTATVSGGYGYNYGYDYGYTNYYNVTYAPYWYNSPNWSRRHYHNHYNHRRYNRPPYYRGKRPPYYRGKRPPAYRAPRRATYYRGGRPPGYNAPRRASYRSGRRNYNNRSYSRNVSRSRGTPRMRIPRGGGSRGGRGGRAGGRR